MQTSAKRSIFPMIRDSPLSAYTRRDQSGGNMPTRCRSGSLWLFIVLAAPALLAQSTTAPTNTAPNPYQTVQNFFQLPQGRTWGSISTVEPDLDGRSVWIVDRCGANSCVGSKLPV